MSPLAPIRKLIEFFGPRNGEVAQTLPTGTSGEFSVVVIDRSWSMSATDYPPSRVRAAIHAASEFIAMKTDAPNDLIAAVGFCETAFVVMQPTPAREAVRAWKACSRMLVPDDGTLLASGLEAARTLLRNRENVSGRLPRIVLLTDGHGGRPIRVARSLKEEGVVIDVIGIGGSPADVNERVLMQIASRVDDDLRYRFIADADALFAHFRRIAQHIVK